MTDAAVTVLALGRRFVEALAVKDPEALGAVLGDASVCVTKHVPYFV